jgi:transcriptional regulator with XRE-family HTH domain
MRATSNTAVPLPLGGMRNEIHSKDPKTILGRNLSAAFKRRGLSARSVSRAINATGMKISNKTVSNMLNGVGNPQIDNLIAVAKQARIPLWQLLCPAVEISQFGDSQLHELLDGIAGLSETGRAQVKRTIKLESLMARQENVPASADDPA